MLRSFMRAMTLTTLGIAGSGAVQADTAVPQDQVDRCLKSVNVIGASMGHQHKAGADGQAMLHFTVRSNGQQYTVKCDGSTGMVKDVSAVLGSDGAITSH